MKVALLVLIALIGRAQELQKITGRVVDSASGTPVIGATVTLDAPEGSEEVVTDGEGSFTFLDVPVGSYTLYARRSEISQSSSRSAAVTLDPEKDSGPVELALPSNALITGQLTGSNGLPVTANIELIHREVRNGEVYLESLGGSVNDLGELRIADLKPGRYLLCATAFTSRYKQHHHLVYPVTCFPGGSAPAAGQWIDLQPGAELHVDLHFELVHAIRVTGAVRGSGDQLFFSIRSLTPGDALPGAGIAEWDGKTRTFVIPALPPGDYVIRASEYRDGKEHSFSRVIHAGTEDINGIDLDLSRDTMLTGSVTFEGDAPTSSNPTSLSASGHRLELYARGNGDFSVPVPPPGSYFFSAHALDYCPKSATLGGRNVLDNRFTISPDAAPGLLNVVFSKDCGKVFVFLESKSDSLKPVLLRREADGNGYLPSGVPLSSGSSPYWATDLTPGDYFVFLVPNDPNLEYMDPAWLRDHESSAIPVTIQASEPTMLKLP